MTCLIAAVLLLATFGAAAWAIEKEQREQGRPRSRHPNLARRVQGCVLLLFIPLVVFSAVGAVMAVGDSGGWEDFGPVLAAVVHGLMIAGSAPPILLLALLSCAVLASMFFVDGAKRYARWAALLLIVPAACLVAVFVIPAIAMLLALEPRRELVVSTGFEAAVSGLVFLAPLVYIYWRNRE